jgi:hypothetical protein
MTAALAAGSRALVYYVQAGAYDRLGDFASRVVTSASDPVLLQNLLPHLEAAAQAAPEGRFAGGVSAHLADALRRGGRPEASLPFYEQARPRPGPGPPPRGQPGARPGLDVAAITGNWAYALCDVGDLEGARRRHLESAEAHKKRAPLPSMSSAANWRPCAWTLCRAGWNRPSPR